MKNTVVKIIWALTFLLSPGGKAGELTLVSEKWDYICTVEVATGLSAPEKPDNIEEFRGVKIDDEYKGGIVYKGFDRLCYRRSLVPDDCHTPLNEWSCYTNITNEAEVINIY